MVLGECWFQHSDDNIRFNIINSGESRGSRKTFLIKWIDAPFPSSPVDYIPKEWEKKYFMRISSNVGIAAPLGTPDVEITKQEDHNASITLNTSANWHFEKCIDHEGENHCLD